MLPAANISPPPDPRDGIGARALRGERQAIKFLIGLMMERPLSAAASRQLRDENIRALADWLAAALPGSSLHKRAQIPATAGEVLGTRRTLPDMGPFGVLDAKEKNTLTVAISEILSFARWPGWRRLLSIIECSETKVCSLPPLAIANAAGG